MGHWGVNIPRLICPNAPMLQRSYLPNPNDALEKWKNLIRSYLSASDVAKEAIQSILQTEIILLPFPNRIQRSIFSHRLAELQDTSDLSHAISAIVNNCEAIITYDIHFQQIEHIIPCWVPEQVIDMILDLLNRGDRLNWL
jgi:CRISPR/Cas system-associated endoribonuclease Cas2